MRIFQNLNVDFLSKRKLYYYFSAGLFLLGLINIIFRGLEFGIDFKGGSEMVIEFDKPVEITQIRGYVEGIGLGNIEVKTFENENSIILRTELKGLDKNIYNKVLQNIDKSVKTNFPGAELKITDSASTSQVTYSVSNGAVKLISEKLFAEGFQTNILKDDGTNGEFMVGISIKDWIKQNLREQLPDNPLKMGRVEEISPKVGDELKVDALIALGLSLLVILGYLAFRYKFIFGLGAVVAVFHDTLITLGLFSILYGVIPGLNLEINLTIVAAFLTLIGYSMNDTVVVFDRVRENLKIHKSMDIQEVINKSLNQTMSRTILTGGTSLMTLLVLIFFGGEVLRAFSFTMFFGIIIGTYSSIFVASAIVCDYAKKAKSKVQF